MEPGRAAAPGSVQDRRNKPGFGLIPVTSPQRNKEGQAPIRGVFALDKTGSISRYSQFLRFVEPGGVVESTCASSLHYFQGSQRALVHAGK